MLGDLGRRWGSRAKHRSARNRRLNKTLGNILLINWSNHTVTSLSVRQHRRSPTIPANNLLGENPLSTKRMVVGLEIGLRDRPEKSATGKNKGEHDRFNRLFRPQGKSKSVARRSWRLRLAPLASTRGQPAFHDRRSSPKRVVCRARDRSPRQRHFGSGRGRLRP